MFGEANCEVKVRKLRKCQSDPVRGTMFNQAPETGKIPARGTFQGSKINPSYRISSLAVNLFNFYLHLPKDRVYPKRSKPISSSLSSSSSAGAAASSAAAAGASEATGAAAANADGSARYALICTHNVSYTSHTPN